MLLVLIYFKDNYIIITHLCVIYDQIYFYYLGLRIQVLRPGQYRCPLIRKTHTEIHAEIQTGLQTKTSIIFLQ